MRWLWRKWRYRRLREEALREEWYERIYYAPPLPGGGPVIDVIRGYLRDEPTDELPLPGWS